jgi:quercetin dioxygenase-like cupin family protein
MGDRARAWSPVSYSAVSPQAMTGLPARLERVYELNINTTPANRGLTMSSIQRDLDGDVLIHHLKEGERMIDQTLVAQHGRSARTLVKQGALRIIIIELAPGGEMEPHSSPGPVSIQVVQGEIIFAALTREYLAKAGEIIVTAPDVEHSVRSKTGGVFLLTVVHPIDDGEERPTAAVPGVSVDGVK